MAPSGGIAYVALEAAGKLLKLDVAGYTVDRQRRRRREPAARVGQRRRQPGLRLALHHAAPAGREHGRRADLERRRADRRRGRRRRRSRAGAAADDRAAPQRQAGRREPGPRRAELPRRRRDLAGRRSRPGCRRSRTTSSAACCATAAASNFQNTVRAISSRIDLASGTEDYAARIDHDNASLASAALFDRQRRLPVRRAGDQPRGRGRRRPRPTGEMFRIDVGRAPQGLALSADGRTLYVNNFMDRTVERVRPHAAGGATALSTCRCVATLHVRRHREAERHGAERQAALLRRDATRAWRATRYMSCASLPQRRRPRRPRLGPDRLRRGPAQHHQPARPRGTAQGFLHWSNNFDEVQDFEGQIRTLAGGTGLMTDAAVQHRHAQPAARRPQGRRQRDLDALAAYVASLNTFDAEPAAQRATAR